MSKVFQDEIIVNNVNMSHQRWTLGHQISEFIYDTKKPQSKQFSYIMKRKPYIDGGLFNEIHFYSGNCKEGQIEEYKESNGLSS